MLWWMGSRLAGRRITACGACAQGGATPLLVASQKGLVGAQQLLIENKADVNQAMEVVLHSREGEGGMCRAVWGSSDWLLLRGARVFALAGLVRD